MTEIQTYRSNASLMNIVFNRPARLNAVNEALYQQTLDALREADADPGIRCIVLSGNGRAFCAGADLKAHKSGDRSSSDQIEYVNLGQNVCKQILCMQTPVIAKVHGYALGGGAEIATAADFMVIADDAEIGFPEAAIGTYVGGGVTYRLPRLIGLRRATDMLFLGKRINGRQAFEYGLAYTAAPTAELDSATEDLLQQLISNAPISLAKLKSALRSFESVEQALASEAGELLDIMQTDDWAEGVTAFAEGRAPEFAGR